MFSVSLLEGRGPLETTMRMPILLTTICWSLLSSRGCSARSATLKRKTLFSLKVAGKSRMPSIQRGFLSSVGSELAILSARAWAKEECCGIGQAKRGGLGEAAFSTCRTILPSRRSRKNRNASR